jgi:hypothetical protein
MESSCQLAWQQILSDAHVPAVQPCLLMTPPRLRVVRPRIHPLRPGPKIVCTECVFTQICQIQNRCRQICVSNTLCAHYFLYCSCTGEIHVELQNVFRLNLVNPPNVEPLKYQSSLLTNDNMRLDQSSLLTNNNMRLDQQSSLLLIII